MSETMKHTHNAGKILSARLRKYCLSEVARSSDSDTRNPLTAKKMGTPGKYPRKRKSVPRPGAWKYSIAWTTATWRAPNNLTRSKLFILVASLTGFIQSPVTKRVPPITASA